MSQARVDASAVLNAAQQVIDAHRSTADCFGRCAECGEPWPCEPRRRAGNSFSHAERLPRRTPAPTSEGNALPWSPVDWFATGRVSTVGLGPETKPVLMWRGGAR